VHFFQARRRGVDRTRVRNVDLERERPPARALDVCRRPFEPGAAARYQTHRRAFAAEGDRRSPAHAGRCACHHHDTS
jgi:hypothetical protein